MTQSLLAEAIRNMGHEELLRAFENPRWGGTARQLLRAELLLRLKLLDALGGMFGDGKGKRRVASPG